MIYKGRACAGCGSTTESYLGWPLDLIPMCLHCQDQLGKKWRDVMDYLGQLVKQ